MLKQLARATYDTETVRKMLEYAQGRPVTTMAVANLARPGYWLAYARLRKNSYDRKKTDEVMRLVLLRRLAGELGRTSDRFLDSDAEIPCPMEDCKGIAVSWNGKWRCECGHEGDLP